MTTWLDSPGDYAESAARDAERDLCAPELRRCPVCGGSGELHRLESPPDPQTRVDYECRYCDASGVVPAYGEFQ